MLEGIIYKVELILGVVLMVGIDYGFDYNWRKILLVLKIFFCLVLIIYKIIMLVLSFLNFVE